MGILERSLCKHSRREGSSTRSYRTHRIVLQLSSSTVELCVFHWVNSTEPRVLMSGNNSMSSCMGSRHGSCKALCTLLCVGDTEKPLTLAISQKTLILPTDAAFSFVIIKLKFGAGNGVVFSISQKSM